MECSKEMIDALERYVSRLDPKSREAQLEFEAAATRKAVDIIAGEKLADVDILKNKGQILNKLKSLGYERLGDFSWEDRQYLPNIELSNIPSSELKDLSSDQLSRLYRYVDEGPVDHDTYESFKLGDLPTSETGESTLHRVHIGPKGEGWTGNMIQVEEKDNILNMKTLDEKTTTSPISLSSNATKVEDFMNRMVQYDLEEDDIAKVEKAYSVFFKKNKASTINVKKHLYTRTGQAFDEEILPEGSKIRKVGEDIVKSKDDRDIILHKYEILSASGAILSTFVVDSTRDTNSY